MLPTASLECFETRELKRRSKFCARARARARKRSTRQRRKRSPARDDKNERARALRSSGARLKGMRRVDGAHMRNLRLHTRFLVGHFNSLDISTCTRSRILRKSKQAASDDRRRSAHCSTFAHNRAQKYKRYRGCDSRYKKQTRRLCAGFVDVKRRGSY